MTRRPKVDRNELTLAIAAALIGAMLLGWCLRWIFAGISNAAGPRSIKQTAQLVTRVQQAEEAQLTAETRLAQIEGDLTQRLNEMQAELEATHADLAHARAQTDEIREAYRQAMGQGARGGEQPHA
jgi:nitrogen fixation/metabolism regulation signal transduction histidine kinase